MTEQNDLEPWLFSWVTAKIQYPDLYKTFLTHANLKVAFFFSVCPSDSSYRTSKCNSRNWAEKSRCTGWVFFMSEGQKAKLIFHKNALNSWRRGGNLDVSHSFPLFYPCDTPSQFSRHNSQHWDAKSRFSASPRNILWLVWHITCTRSIDRYAYRSGLSRLYSSFG